MTADQSDSWVVMAHGGGGQLMQDLIRDHVLPRLENRLLSPLDDGADLGRLDGRVVFTTDSYVVTPLVFPGGDIGRLAVCGTVNDVAMMGARPLALSLGLIVTEGLSLATLDQVLDSVAAAAQEAGVHVVTGDTKVIERPAGEQGAASAGLFVNTAGVGVRPDAWTDSAAELKAGDLIVINGPIAEHGLAVMSVREGLEFASTLQSDVAPLNGLVSAVFEAGIRPKFMRDPTRGGLATVLADVCESTGLTVELDEVAIPVSPTARHAAEMLGLDPLTVANEGKCVLVVSAADEERLLRCLSDHPLGAQTATIGRLTDTQPPIVELVTQVGGRRVVQRPYGEELPRIC